MLRAPLVSDLELGFRFGLSRIFSGKGLIILVKDSGDLIGAGIADFCDFGAVLLVRFDEE